jgi:cytochrome c oxidase subunit 2
MGGWVIVMEPDEYDRWLSGGTTGETMESAGQSLFQERGCANCHVADGSGRGPSLAGKFGQPVRLATGEAATVNEAYLRQAILTPNTISVPGYTQLMQSYQGQLSEEQILDLIAYIRSLREEGKP